MIDMATAPGALALLAIALIGAGLLTGFMAGLLGIGGGGVMVPVLYEVLGLAGVDPSLRMHMALGTSLCVMVPTSLRSFKAHQAKGAVDMEVWRSMAPGVVAGVVGGVLIARYANKNALQVVWIVSATLMALKMFFGRDGWRLGDTLPGNPFRAIFAGFVGLLSALMSIGGAAYIVMFMTLHGRSMHQAVATSSGFGALISIPGSIGMAWAGYGLAGLPPGSIGYVSLLGAALIIPTSVFAAPYGAHLAHGLSRRTLELGFGAFMSIVALKFLIGLVI